MIGTIRITESRKVKKRFRVKGGIKNKNK
jgi:hypothetical protein